MRRQFESKNCFLANNPLINSVWYCWLFNSIKFGSNVLPAGDIGYHFNTSMQQFPKQITPLLSLKRFKMVTPF